MMSSSLRTLDGLERVGQLGADLLHRRPPAAIEDLHDLALTACQVGAGWCRHGWAKIFAHSEYIRAPRRVSSRVLGTDAVGSFGTDACRVLQDAVVLELVGTGQLAISSAARMSVIAV